MSWKLKNIFPWISFDNNHRLNIFRISFFIVPLLFSLLCFVPIILNWKLDYSDYINPTDSPIYTSMNSLQYEYSLVASVAISLPMLLDFFFDIASPGFKFNNQGVIARGILLSALFLSNLFILVVVLPLQNPELLAVVIRARGIIWISASFVELYDFGLPAKSLVCLTIFNAISSVLLCFIGFDKTQSSNILYIIFLILELIGAIVFIRLSFMWFLHVSRIKYRELSTQQYCCNVYMISLWFMVAGFTMLYIFDNGGKISVATSSFYFTAHTYLIVGFTVVISVLQGRVSHKQILQTQQTLETKRMFVRFVSHEIRTPLNTVFLGLKLLKQQIRLKKSTDEYLVTIEDMHDSCDIALNTLNDLLSYEKLEAGILKLEKTTFSALDFLLKAVKPFFVQSRQLEIDLHILNETELRESLHYVNLSADRHKLAQVVRNYISNALKFTPPKGMVTVSADIVTRSKEFAMDGESADFSMKSSKFLRIKVKDTGPGINKDDIGKVFNEIVQFSPGVLQNGGGSGFGLWICRRIIDLHEGQVAVESEGEGQGCTFSFEVPIFDPQQSRACSLPSFSATIVNLTSGKFSHIAPTSQIASSPVDFTPVEIYAPGPTFQIPILEFQASGIHEVEEIELDSSLNVLIVDDAALNRKMLKKLLAHRVNIIHEAIDGQDAIQKYLEFRTTDQCYDVILMDSIMPIKDGPTTTAEIRALGFNGLIVGATGNILQEDIDYFIAQGADRVLSKPVDLRALEVVIADLPQIRNERKSKRNWRSSFTSRLV